jgi:hypothetical protein
VALGLAGLAMSSAGCERGAETAGDRASVGVGADMDTIKKGVCSTRDCREDAENESASLYLRLCLGDAAVVLARS